MLCAVCTRRLPERPMGIYHAQSGSGLAPASYQGLLDDWNLKLMPRGTQSPISWVQIKRPKLSGLNYLRSNVSAWGSCSHLVDAAAVGFAPTRPARAGLGVPHRSTSPARRSPVSIVQSDSEFQ